MKIRKKFILLITGMTLMLSACSASTIETAEKELDDVITNTTDSDNRYVIMVKNGYREDNPSLTYEKAFSDFFSTPRWKYFKSEEDQDIVEFTGDCTYMDAAVKARIQFVIDEENETFQATYLAFNEVPQDVLTLAALIEKTFEVDESMYQKTKPAKKASKKTKPKKTKSPKIDNSDKASNDETEYTVDEAKKIFNKWLAAHPFGIDAEISLIDENAINENGEECYEFNLCLVKEGEEDILLNVVFINKFTGSITIGDFDQKSIDKWYKEDWLSGDWDIDYEAAWADNDDNYDNSGYILPNSDSQYLTMNDLNGLSADNCRLARNEIYARYGRKFDSKDLQDYFNSCYWYHGTIEPDDFKDSILSDIEIANRDLIIKYEEKMGYQ